MFLKKLDLIGFKSFADPTAITFQPGITVIVGPNGCGKSNIVDAILWVLGEQSTKTLRSDRMEDVIFNGSESRKPINMAEVILTVGGVSQEEVGNQFGEFEVLSLSRRLFRSGESEYFVNRIPCRLRDVRDVLIDTGAGHKGHTIIEQGKVDQLLNASPLERRELIEETAGISKYKIRKAEAERKLEATQLNLLRVRDIIVEVKRQIQGLDRQVKRTETYHALRAEAQHLSLLLLADEFRTGHRAWQGTSRQVQEAQEKESAFLARLSAIEAEIQTLKTGLVAEEQGLAGLRQQAYDLMTQIQRQESRMELLQSQITGWEEQCARLAKEQEQLGQARTKAATEAKEVRHQLGAMNQSLKQRQQELAARDRAHQELSAKIAQRETALEKNKAHLFDLLSRITEAKNQVAALESRYREILRVYEKGRSELATVASELKEHQKTVKSEKALWVALEKKVGEAQKQQRLLSETVGQKREALAQQTLQLDQQREKLAHAQARLASLNEQEKSLLISEASIRQHLSARSDILSRFHGIVADGLSVPKPYERAIEAALGDRLQALIAEDHPTIGAAIAHLRTAGAARSVFVPKTLRMKPGIAGTLAREGVIGPALAHVEIRSGFETLLQALLGGVILVRDLEVALALWKQQPLSETLVTLEGEIVFPSGMVASGQAPEETRGLLQVRRKVKEAGQEVQRLKADLAQTEEGRIRQTQEMEHLLSEQEALIQSLHESELAATAQSQKVAALEGEVERFSEHLSLLQEEDRQGAREAKGLKTSMEQVRKRLEALEREQTQLEEKLANEQEDLKQWADQRTRLASELTDLKVSLTSLTERQETLLREAQRLEQEQIALEEQVQQRQAEAAGLVSKIQAAQQDHRETEVTIGTLGMKLSQAQGVLTEKTQQYTEHIGRLKQLEDQQSGVRAEWGRVERELKDLEVRQAELKIKLEQIKEQLAGSHSTTPEEALRVLDQEPFHQEEAGMRLLALREKIEQMGAVNLAAPEEYKELEERYRFLTAQEADLTQSIEDLKKAIQKINRTTKEMFLSAYQALKVKFSEVFSAFFEGGQADLILLDEDNPLESGIEILAQPPGKRLKSIVLLSGGEKALTAIALLFSSFLIHPSPFCVLDEIDAPLDEENTRRFLRVLREMTDHSQFLIMTHNKRTMEQADILYGVTMEEHGVSKLVSVKLTPRGNGGAGTKPKLKAAASPSPSV